jgi:hypothetical protein
VRILDDKSITEEDIVDGTLIIPKGINTIGKIKYNKFEGLKHVIVSKTVKHIGVMCFHGCSELESVVILNRNCTISIAAFNTCINLKYVELPENLKLINDETFKYCSSLEHISIPKSVIEIHSEAFKFCSSIKEIELPTRLEVLGHDALQLCDKLRRVRCSSKVKYMIKYGDKTDLQRFEDRLMKCLAINLYKADNIEEIIVDNKVIRVRNVDGEFCRIEDKVDFETKLIALKVYKAYNIAEYGDAKEIYYAKYKDIEVICENISEIEYKIKQQIKKRFIVGIG